MDRRQFASLSLSVLILNFFETHNINNLHELLLQIQSPFRFSKESQLEGYKYLENKFKDKDNINLIRINLLSMIKNDNLNNRVDVIDGKILSHTEIRLYAASQLYA